MVNVAIVESTEFLKVRLANIVKKSEFGYVDINELSLKNASNYNSFFDKSNLIIFDLDNKSLDILKIVKSIKNSSITSDIPIVALSSQADFKLLKKAIESGCDDFITKPFSNEMFLEKLYKHASNAPYTLLNDMIVEDDTEIDYTDIKFVWNEEFELGLSEIDDEHSQIVNNFEKLYTYMKEGRGHEYYLELIAFLDDYVENHFKNEEKFQESIGYNRIREHKMIHSNFKTKVKAIIENSKINEVKDIDLIRLNLFIKDWLINHILIEDRRIAEFIELNKKESR